MRLNIVFIICSLFAFSQLNAQEKVENILQKIEQNNKELKAFATYIKSKKLELKSENNLPNPEVGAYFLPWGEHSDGNYTEFEISQTFEFPTVYISRKKWIKNEQTSLDYVYELKKQEVLFSAKKELIKLISLQNLMKLEEERIQKAEKVYEQTKQLFEKEQIGILDQNKAKIAWLQKQFDFEKLQTEIQNQKLSLESLNGGEALNFSILAFDKSVNLAPLSELWEQKKMNDFMLKQISQKETVALQKYKLSKNKSLPNLTAGFNYQGVAGNNYSGLYGGISIPLWNNKNKVKAAKIDYESTKIETEASTLKLYADFQQKYNSYQTILSKYEAYKETLESMNSSSLLLKAYELGEIDFITYFQENHFYEQAINKVLEMKKELYLLQAELFKYQL
ncbi:TolC family protein [Aureivirga sp. CE67]|uniref:TolC family protein n=1 Tax=Aureivirga sp. CE67 TaxID=1788983 RepID=UPI0018CB1A34|nr:TolC family protein [Aureivirga sp. CE67]